MFERDRRTVDLISPGAEVGLFVVPPVFIIQLPEPQPYDVIYPHYYRDDLTPELVELVRTTFYKDYNQGRLSLEKARDIVGKFSKSRYRIGSIHYPFTVDDAVKRIDTLAEAIAYREKVLY